MAEAAGVLPAVSAEQIAQVDSAALDKLLNPDTPATPESGPAESAATSVATATPAPAASAAESKATSEVTVQSLQTELDEVKKNLATKTKQVNDKEGHLRWQQSEIDRLREQLKTKAQTARQQANETVNTVEQAERIAEAREAEAAARNLEGQSAIIQNRIQINTMIPDFESLIPDIAAIAKEQGMPEQIIEEFKRNPYNEPVGIVMGYATAARARKQISGLQEKIKTLETKPAEVVQKIAQAAKAPTTITASTATGPSAPEISVSSIGEMSTDQLNALLTEKRKTEKLF